METKGFTSIHHDILNGMIMSDLSARQLKCVLLILRTSKGCHTEWARLQLKDFLIAGITQSHIKEVMSELILKGAVIKNGLIKEYKLNVEYFIKEWPQAQRLVKVIGKNLVRNKYIRPYQNSNPIPTKGGISVLLKEEENNSLKGNFATHNLASAKDNSKDKFKNNDKDISIGDEQNGFEKIIQTPSTKKEYEAVSLWKMLEPDRPKSFGFYLKAVNYIPSTTLFRYASEIKQDEQIAPINRGKVFNFKVQRYNLANKLSQ